MTPVKIEAQPPFYGPRNGVNVTHHVETLFAPAKIELNERESRHAFLFARGLFDGRLSPTLMCASKLSLEQVHTISVASDEHEFYMGYFQTAEGKGVASEPLIEMGKESFSEALCSTEDMLKIPAKTCEQLALKSRDWYRGRLLGCLEQSPAGGAPTPDGSSVTFNTNPEKLLQKLEGLRDYKDFYKEAKKELQESEDSQLKTVKETLLNQYRGRVNNLLASLYPSALHLARQLSSSEPSVRIEEWQQRLYATLPLLERLFQQEGKRRDIALDGLARRLDLLRNGADWDGQGGQYAIPVSRELRANANGKKERTKAATTEHTLPSEVVELLDTIRWDAAQLQTFNEVVLAEKGLLSERQAAWDEVKGRSGFAEDGKWQVVITPKKKNVAVDSTKGVLLIPESFDRSLTSVSPAGALPVSAHELTHIFQAEWDRRIGRRLPLARIKGRRYITMREAGGIHQERIIQSEYCGRERPANFHYLRALDAKRAGRTQVEVARAFYDSYVEGREAALSPQGRAEAFEFAIDRSQRLYRNYGHDSQPLDYSEQELIVKALGALQREEVAAFLIGGGSFNTADSAELHRVGQLEVPSPAEIISDPAHDVMRIFLRNFYLHEIASAYGVESPQSSRRLKLPQFLVKIIPRAIGKV